MFPSRPGPARAPGGTGAHLLAPGLVGTHALDLAAMSVFLYCFIEREKILDIKELISGARMMTTYLRPGGLWRDVPVEFESAVRKFIDEFPPASTNMNRS